MNLKNIFISIIMVLLAVYGGFKLYLHFDAKSKIDRMVTSLRMAGIDAKYDRISTSIFGFIGVKGLELRFPQVDESITFGEVMVGQYEQAENQLPSVISASFENIKFNMRLVDALLKQSKQEDAFKDSPNWREMGYDTIQLDMDLEMKYIPANNEFVLNITQDIKDVWDIRFMMDLTDMPINQPPTSLGMRLKELRFEYKDRSFAERVYKWHAEKDGMDTAAYKQRLLTEFDNSIEEKKPKLSKESIQVLRAFIDKPDRIVVTMYPYKPVAFTSLKHYDSADVPMLLNLRFVKN